MKWTLASLLLFSLTTSMADVSPDKVATILDQMVEKNIISAIEAEKAKIRMKTMAPNQWEELKSHAQTAANARLPASVVEDPAAAIKEIHKADLNRAQFKAIQSEVEKILPQFKKN